MPNQLAIAKRSDRKEVEEEAIRQLLIHKQNLRAELQNFESLVQNVKTDVNLDAKIEIVYSQGVSLLIETAPNLIYAVLIFCEGVFANGESQVTIVEPAKVRVEIALNLHKHQSADLILKIMFGVPDSDFMHVIEANKSVPTFTMLKYQSPAKKNWSDYKVLFRSQERIQRVICIMN